ncbi:MAG: hypothetical protein EBS98_09300, partial [Chitinophagia bacterium]|nr:hypothetical protein [Chitinophagia bacterium]
RFGCGPSKILPASIANLASNYGKFGWHLDHIQPCASFDLTDPSQQKKCFHYSNIQPLWAKDNWSKGSR